MKTTIALLVVILLSGCIAQLNELTNAKTLPELRAEARITGDWSRVERREAKIANMSDYDKAVLVCRSMKPTRMLYCKTTGTRLRLDECSCQFRRDVMDTMPNL